MSTLSDSQLFAEWGPPCTGDSARITLYGGGKVTVHPLIVEAVKAMDSVFTAFNYLTHADQVGAYVCRDKVGQPGKKSIHALKLALDINWKSNPFGPRLITDMPRPMVDAILAIRTVSGAQVWTWGGDWRGNKDAMHYQIGCTKNDVKSRINWATVAGPASPSPAPIKPPAHTPDDEEDDMSQILSVNEPPANATDLPQGAVVRITNETWKWLNPAEYDLEKRLALLRQAPLSDPLPPISQGDMRAYQSSRIDVAKLNAAASR